MAYLAIVRHGQSVWNLENRFTGEVDVDLSPQGEAEARQAGQLLTPYPVDCAFTSVLKRAIRTLDIIMQQTGQTNLPVTRSAALNERNYGDLQGLNKDDVAKQYGVKQVDEWRRSYDVVPPHGESLEHTYERVVPYYQANIEPTLAAGQNVLIVAHGNSLRSLMMYLEKISPEDIAKTELATGVPRLYLFDNDMKLEKATYLSVSEKDKVIGV
ncbi:2,3-diphosphoglycerate-dependent phosphoglycerate mutase [Fibrella sp. HMF5335]|uniref:2,3-bisphosphoglycerate-dependent phosphoglycerate mutase n=1 Tax=Fibrella rubiginis TaxID=2817060 RepID=A0A939GGT3_9BACT|nr:2,3-diphosphoglycerate-dependent phosphoglycerate mutase [Fibrella rubiginis]MBO0936944.1 2,3-diphosphoglycerate-dependent phosphoglycerate mutase [Fibrella rubiginis]